MPNTWEMLRDTYPQMEGFIMVLVVITLAIILVKQFGIRSIYGSTLIYCILVVFFHAYGAISIQFAITGFAGGAIIMYILFKGEGVVY